MSGAATLRPRGIKPDLANQAGKAPRLLGDLVRQRLADYREMQRCPTPPTKD